MKPLLTWCGTRALGEKPPSVKGEDQHLVLAAREIQSQLLRDFSTRSSLSNCFARMEGPAMSTNVLQPDLQREASSEWVSQPRNAIWSGKRALIYWHSYLHAVTAVQRDP